MPQNVQKDHGYAWVIVIVCASTTSLFKGAQFGTMGVLFVEWMDYFDQPYSFFTSLNALFFCIGNFLAPIFSILIKLYGSRVCTIIWSLVIFVSYTVCAFAPTLTVLYIFFGVFAGIGFSGLHLSGEVITQQYFDIRRGLAVGILSTFSGIGVLIWPLLNTYLVNVYSWQGALLIQAAIFANGVVGGCLMRPFPIQNDAQSDSLTFTSELHMVWKRLNFREWKGVTRIRIVSYIVYLFGLILAMFGYQLSLVYSPKRAVLYDLSHEKASFLVSIIGFFAPTRLLFGWMGDHRKVNRLILIAICSVIGGTVNAISVINETYVYLISLQIVQAISAAGIMAVMPAILVDILGSELVVMASGFYIFAHGTANLIVHLAAGPILQFLGVNTLFVVFGISQILGGVLFIISYAIMRKAATESHDDNDENNDDVKL